MSFVLTEKINQNCIEDNFGRHRGLGRRNENPLLFQFGYDSNTIRMQRSIVPVTGNTRGGCKEKRHVSWEIVDETPLQKGLREKSCINEMNNLVLSERNLLTSDYKLIII